MPKLKSHKGLLKRIKITGTGKVRRRRVGSGHLLSHKTGEKKRDLRKPRYMKRGDVKHMERMLHRPLRGIDAGPRPAAKTEE